jgi:hypothetical protein
LKTACSYKNALNNCSWHLLRRGQKKRIRWKKGGSFISVKFNLPENKSREAGEEAMPQPIVKAYVMRKKIESGTTTHP